jgi:hypothetical protein
MAEGRRAHLFSVPRAPAVGWNRPPLTVDLILVWADDHKARTGELPRICSGPVLANPNETWRNLDNALRGDRHEEVDHLGAKSASRS